mmetsp:Transcript_59888/g.128496  ORF Transcript_59888/g.128496 Transcript_59888/m.128496 type:complete len:91 (+) Transcript_59888:1000-1272(+)
MQSKGKDVEVTVVVVIVAVRHPRLSVEQHQSFFSSDHPSTQFENPAWQSKFIAVDTGRAVNNTKVMARAAEHMPLACAMVEAMAEQDAPL